MEFGAKNKIWNEMITLKPILMKTQPKFFKGSISLCQLDKCSACLEINEKMRENEENCQKTKLCLIRQKLTPMIKGMCFWKDRWTMKGINRHQKTLTNY
jgi:hypothetical protein